MQSHLAKSPAPHKEQRMKRVRCDAAGVVECCRCTLVFVKEALCLCYINNNTNITVTNMIYTLADNQVSSDLFSMFNKKIISV